MENQTYRDRQGNVIAEGEEKIAPSPWTEWGWKQVEKMDLPEKTMEVYREHGLNIKAKCAGCIHLKQTYKRDESGHRSISVYRCTAYGDDVDWSGQWPACGDREGKIS